MDIVISAVVVVVVMVAAYYILKSTEATPSSTIQIVGEAEDAQKELTYSKHIPRSVDQPEGMTFSYAGWVRIDDFTYRYGAQKIIFVKGSSDMSSACPAFLIDANSNTFLLKIDTHGTQETVSIDNIPAKKWIHFAIAVDQDSVDVYINGVLKTHHTLSQLPRQNSGQLYVTPDGGFKGKVANLQYFTRLLSPSEASSLASVRPDDPESKQVYPPYFAGSWWTTE